MNEMCVLMKMVLNEKSEPTKIAELVNHRLTKHICPVQLALCWRELEDKKEVRTIWRGKKENMESRDFSSLDELFAQLNLEEYTDIVGYLEII